jgi:hypothetical protein
MSKVASALPESEADSKEEIRAPHEYTDSDLYSILTSQYIVNGWVSCKEELDMYVVQLRALDDSQAIIDVTSPKGWHH